MNRSKDRITDEQAARLDVVMRHIHEHPEQHHQGTWFTCNIEGVSRNRKLMEFTCGSTACVAGHIAARQGYRFVLERDEDDRLRSTYVTSEPLRGKRYLAELAVPKGKPADDAVPVYGLAAEAIGLESMSNEADELFNGCATRDELYRLAWCISDGRTFLPPDIDPAEMDAWANDNTYLSVAADAYCQRRDAAMVPA